MERSDQDTIMVSQCQANEPAPRGNIPAEHTHINAVRKGSGERTLRKCQESARSKKSKSTQETIWAEHASGEYSATAGAPQA